jgi:threonine dehydratase
LLFVLCSSLFALCCLFFALCSLFFALCSLFFMLCFILPSRSPTWSEDFAAKKLMTTPSDIIAAAHRIAPFVATTPLERSRPLSTLTSSEVYLKLECAQRTGSFKLRGATNALALLEPTTRARGVVAASAGNHALGVAEAAEQLGVHATLCVPGNASPAKIAALRRYSIDLQVVGATYEDAETAAQALALDTGRAFVSAYSGIGQIAGQGTLGVEVLAALPHADALLVPVGGGGLAAGVALWAKAVRPQIALIGVQSEASCVMYHSLQAGIIRNDVPELPSLADGLAGSVDPHTLTLPILQRLLDRMLLVTEAEIAGAMRYLLDEHHLVVEGSGAVGVAALLADKLPEVRGRMVVALLTGRNVASNVLTQLLH